jgi:hypothetical protein
MPQPRKRKADAEPEDTEAQDEEGFEDEGGDGDGGANGLAIDVGEDRVIIELPRDGNERPTLEAIGAMLESMS